MAVERLPRSDDRTQQPEVIRLLARQGIEAVVISRGQHVESIRTDLLPHVALADMASLSDSDLRHCLERCSQLRIPVIGLVPEDHLADLDESLGLDDFVVSPPSPPELVVRARRVLKRSKSPDADNVIRNGDLDIDPTSYEVSLKGRPVNLRFKEYELLRLLATNPGRVYTRESLLSQIWGYDYFGGTRTVDVHIRRLRSKIEDADHSFIETIWNVGYRFRDVSQSR